MDAYPPELVTHETPLLLVSGLGSSERYADLDTSDVYSYPQLSQNGSRVTSAVAPVTTPAGEMLLDYFIKTDSSGIWAGRTTEKLKSQTPAWRIRPVGRNYILPPRKANPPADENFTSPLEGPPTRIQALHSPVSPLSPESPLYPDGVITPLWLRKHQLLLPAAFCAAYELYTESNDLPIQNQKDNELIAAINSQKKLFSPNLNNTSSVGINGEDIRSSGHRSKFVVVILSEKSILSSPRIDDRLSYIKRSTNLVPSVTFFFLPAHSSPVEVQQFVVTLLTTLYPSAIEYYRELSKHSRRKRNKGSIPPPTVPSSRALSQQAWNLRFEFKLGMFAEFRQEMDVAARNYEAAYEKLFAEVFETTTSWSERWTEARLLADIMSLRIVRCHLWGEQYTAAKRRWGYHITQMTGVLDRKGLGTNTYGFSAWMSRWNRCLAELLQVANLQVFTPIAPLSPRSPMMLALDVVQEAQTLYALPEKTISVSDRLTPQDYLHHQGFYFLRAAEYMSERAHRAKRISLSDSENTHDTYLCPSLAEELSSDHNSAQITLLMLARREFEVRQQRRMADGITYTIAKLKMHAAPNKPELWGEALKDLRTMAGVYRKEGWWQVLEDVLWGIIECGHNSGDGGSVVVAGLELLCKGVFRERKGWKYDLGRCLEAIETVKVRPTMVVRGSDVVSFLTASYTFENTKVHVGDSVASQLVITSSAQPSSVPIVFSELKINYEGSLKTILLRHDPSTASPVSSSKMTKLDLKGKIHEQHHNHDEPLPSPTSIKSFLIAETDLSLSPGETKIFELSSILREAGEAKAICATFVYISDGFELDFMIMLDTEDEESSVHVLPNDAALKRQLTANGGNGVWWIEAAKKGEDGVTGLCRKPLRAPEPGRVEILPRPPKMDVTAKSAVEGDIYINEIVRIKFEAMNGEDEEAIVNVEVKILGWPGDEPPHITWLQEDGAEEPPTASIYPLGKLTPSASAKRTFTFPSPSVPADCAIEITAHYHLVSDPETPISKPVVAEMPVINPFRTSFDFSPRVHPELWPDYFSLSEGDITAGEDGKGCALGIKQRWCLTVGIAGMGEGEVEIEGWELPVLGVAGGVIAEVVETGNNGNTMLKQGSTSELLFIIDIHKLSLEDRRVASADVNLNLKWRRKDISPEWPVVVNTTSLPVPRLPIPGSEPRVLAAVVVPAPSQPITAVAVLSPPKSPPITRARTTSTTGSLIPTPANSNIDIPGILHLEYTLENPTNYFLTFNVVMEANEEFAFSGPKQTSLQLLPVSRVTLRYRIFTYKVDQAAKTGKKSGGVEWATGTKKGDEEGGVTAVISEGGLWIRPGLRVVDRYFNKTLRVSPGSQGVAVDKAGLMVWVPCKEEVGEE